MTRTLAFSIALLCSLIAGCATEGSGSASTSQEEAYTPTGSNIPRRSAKPPATAATGAGQSGSTGAKPAQ